MEGIHRALALDAKQLFDPPAGLRFGLFKFRRLGGGAAGFLSDEVVRDGCGDDEISVRKALHQCGSTEPVRAVVGEVGFA